MRSEVTFSCAGVREDHFVLEFNKLAWIALLPPPLDDIIRLLRQIELFDFAYLTANILLFHPVFHLFFI